MTSGRHEGAAIGCSFLRVVVNSMLPNEIEKKGFHNSQARRHIMQVIQNRRRFLATLSSAGAAGLIGASKSSSQEAPPETTTIRLAKMPGICIAPQYVAEEMLKTEGFTDIQY